MENRPNSVRRSTASILTRRRSMTSCRTRAPSDDVVQRPENGANLHCRGYLRGANFAEKLLPPSGCKRHSPGTATTGAAIASGEVVTAKFVTYHNHHEAPRRGLEPRTW